MSDNNKYYHDDLIEYLKELRNNKYYTRQRIDTILIVISTSGIFVLSNLLIQEKYQLIGLKASVLFFALAIILNLISQVLSSELHTSIEHIYQKKINDLRYKNEIQEQQYKEKEKRIRKFSIVVIGFNYSSLVLLLSAVVLSTLTFVSIF